MKSSLKKLREFALHRGDQNQNHHSKEGKRRRDAGPHLTAPVSPHEELLQAAQEMQDMKSGYDSLFSAAAATANCAYEFSEALREMGTCLEKIVINNDDQCGKVLQMLGKAQFDLQKLVDNYRVHVIKTISTPSESLIKELGTVEEMKRQCDYKRDLYKFMQAAQSDATTNNKLRLNLNSKQHKIETFSHEQVKQAQDDYNEEATLFVFRLKSLKQGQFRSLLTQATRHHAAQLNFFRKGTNALQSVEPLVRSAAESQHIDYHFSELDDDLSDDDVAGQDDVSNEGSELSFDYVGDKRASDHLGRKSVEESDPFSFNGSAKPVSQSEPLLPNKNPDQSDRIKAILQRSPSVKKNPNSYVLPTPTEENSQPRPSLSKTLNPISHPLWFSSPLQPNPNPNPNPKIPRGNENMPLPTPQKVPLKESNVPNPRNRNNRNKPKISELHELPRPPAHQSSPAHRSSQVLIPHSAPLAKPTQDKDRIKDKDRRGINVILQGKGRNLPSPLPAPPVQRSFSIPSSVNRREVEGIDAKLAEGFKEKNLREGKQDALKTVRDLSSDSESV